MNINEPITIDGQPYGVTTDHPRSSYGIPVLVSADDNPHEPGKVFGPDDTCVLLLEAGSDAAVQALRSAGYPVEDCRG